MKDTEENTSKNYCTFYIVRHGETDWNARKLIQGQVDIPLNANGEQQAKELSKELSSIKFDAIYSSDLLRAKHTAEIIALEHTLAVQTTELLRERAFGPYEGALTQALRAFDEVFKKLSYEEKFRHKLHETIESDEELVFRFITFIREAAITHVHKTILITTHSGIMRAFLVHIGFLTYEHPIQGSIKNTAYVKLLSDGVDFFVKETKGIETSLTQQ